MTTIKCTREEFNQAFVEFRKQIGITSNTQDQIGNMYKGLVLHYLGIQDIDDDEVDKCAEWLKVASKEALARGWTLLTPDDIGE